MIFAVENMAQKRGVIFWDFDGTLVRFTSWRLALMDVLNECETGHDVDDDELRPFLRDRFPWHRPEEPHTHLGNSDDWWQALKPVLAGCFRGVGYNEERAGELASQVRRHMIKPGRYVLYDDVVPALAELKKEGWRNVILSNHIPELPGVVNALGLSPYIDLCITSAATGYEKPNLQAFRLALICAGNPERAWVVGDNVVSDVRGAEAVGIPAILVRADPSEDVKYSAVNLHDALQIIRETASD